MELKFKIQRRLLFMLSLIVLKSQAQEDVKKGPLINFNYQQPLFSLKGEQSLNKHRMLRFSTLTGYREGVENVSKGLNSDFDKQTGTIRLYMYNLSIVDILTVGMVSPDNIILDVKDPSKFRYDKLYGSELEWRRKNCYCFEYVYPRGTFKSSEMLYKEFTHYFGVKTGWEMRRKDVLVLFRTSKKERFKSRNTDKGYSDPEGHFHNVNISTLSDAFKSAGLPQLIDETDYKGNIDLDLNIKSWSDLSALRKELQRYDLDLKFEKKEVKMFVIKELNNSMI